MRKALKSSNGEVTRDPILRDRRVKALIGTSAERQAIAEAATEHLRRKHKDLPLDDAVRCVVKSLVASRQKITVFIAYQEEDTAVADCLKGRLEEFGPEKLDVYTFTDRTENPGGDEWRKLLIDKIRRSSWFIAIMPDGTNGSSWPLYESALFEGSKMATDLLIAITRPGVPFPAQLAAYNGFFGDERGVFALFDQLMRKPGQLPGWAAIHPKLTDKTISVAAKEVADEFKTTSHSVEWQFFVRFVELDVSRMAEHPDGRMRILDATVLSARGSEEIFGVPEATIVGKTLREVVASINDDRHGTAWLSELDAAVDEALHGRTPTPIRTSFRAFEEGRDFHPHLSSMSRRGGAANSVRVTFTSSLVARISNVPRALDAFMTAVRLAHRFRWEIIEPYMFGDLTKDDVLNFQKLLTRMETEGSVSGTMDPELVLAEVEDLGLRDVVRKIYAEWKILRDDHGDLTKAIETRDAALLSSIMPKLNELNRQFMQVAVRAAPGVVLKHWHPESDGDSRDAPRSLN